MSCSLNSSKGAHIGGYICRLQEKGFKGGARSLDYSSFKLRTKVRLWGFIGNVKGFRGDVTGIYCNFGPGLI